MPNSSGRFIGTLRMSSEVHTPSRLGWPQEVRGAFQSGLTTAAAIVSAGRERSSEGSAGSGIVARIDDWAAATPLVRAASIAKTSAETLGPFVFMILSPYSCVRLS